MTDFIKGNILYATGKQVALRENAFSFLSGARDRVLLYGDNTENIAYYLLAKMLKHYEKVVLIGLGDYHDGYLFDLNLIANYLFSEGLDPVDYLNKMLVSAAYNINQLEKLSGMLREHAESPVFLLNIDRIAKNAKDYPKLNNVLWKIASNNVSHLFLTASTHPLSKDYPPKPQVPHFVRHLVDIIAYVRVKTPSEFVLYLLKHPLKGYSKITIGGEKYWAETLHP